MIERDPELLNVVLLCAPASVLHLCWMHHVSTWDHSKTDTSSHCTHIRPSKWSEQLDRHAHKYWHKTIKLLHEYWFYVWGWVHTTGVNLLLVALH